MRSVVVGHGRSADGRGWGEKIDAEDIVVRMWDCDWQVKRDYGKRYDYGLVTAHKRAFKPFSETRLRTPGKGWLVYDMGAVNMFSSSCPNATVIDDRLYREEATRLGARTKGQPFTLTRGTVAAIYLLTEWLIDVVLVGFDIIRAGRVPMRPYSEAFNKQAVDRYGPGGHRDKGLPAGTERTVTHDFTVESRLIEKFAQDAGRRVHYAEDIWQ